MILFVMGEGYLASNLLPFLLIAFLFSSLSELSPLLEMGWLSSGYENSETDQHYVALYLSNIR